MGRASDFARWEQGDNTIIIGEGVTEVTDVAYYDIKIRVYDNFDEIEEDEKQADEDCDPAADKDCDPPRVAGETWYNVTLAIAKEQVIGEVYVPPAASEVIYTYEG